jgi:LPXTG-motif cell wall-anchored protein
MNQSVANLVIVGLAVIGSLALRLAGRRKENLPRATP